MNVEEIVKRLESQGDIEVVAFKKKKFGIEANNALGVFQKEINALAREAGKNSDRAIALFDTGIYEARVLSAKTFKPKDLNMRLVNKWTASFENWEICDSFSMAVYAKSTLAKEIIYSYSLSPDTFVKRSAFATMAAYCMADKNAGNEVYLDFFKLIKQAAGDDRVYVKKAVNWALRSIGKRNIDLREASLECAHDLLSMDCKSAKWIARDAIRELSDPGVRMSDYPRKIYRP